MGIIDYIKDIHIFPLIVIILLLGGLDFVYGVHLGIEFVGGTQIPLTLQHSVDPANMSTLQSILQQRVSTFGLKQVTVEGVGDDNVYVIIPSVSQQEIQGTINIIESQGVFQAIVDGREALNGSSVIGGTSIGTPAPIVSNDTVTWEVTFLLTETGAVRFSKVVFGQANQPVYLFLDRPTSSIVLVNGSLLSSQQNIGFSQSSEIAAMHSAVVLGNQTIPIEVLDPGGTNWGSLSSFFSTNKAKYKNVILARDTPNSIVGNLTSLNYSITYVSNSNMTPQFISTASNLSSSAIVNVWPAVGLLSAPILNPTITNGSVSQQYDISGPSPSNLSLTAQETFAVAQEKNIASILSGGALPVPVIVGTPTTIPATLGRHFEVISGIVALIAVLAVSAFIVIRYKKKFLIAPILLTTFAELFIIVSIIGLIGTIDLAAVAGMIAVIGTGVDAQIIITDEILSGGSESSVKLKLGNAFYVVWADAAMLIFAMAPLLFSASLVSIIGFSESTILGALLGVLITRPAYGQIVSRHYSK